MLAQALEIHAVNPNVMVKVPGTAEGYEIIEELTSRGIATNNTLTFVLSQLLGVAAQRAITDMRKKVMAHVTRLPVRYFDSTQTGTTAAEEFSITIGVPRVTMVMRDKCFSCSVSETVRLSIL